MKTILRLAAALHVIENLFGHGLAQRVPLAEEYDGQRSSTFVRAALADW